MSKRVRSANIDIIKIMSLVFLYIAHSTATAFDQGLNLVLMYFVDYSFMFLSGYLCKKSLESRNYKFGAFWKSKFENFVVPFWLMLVVWFLAQRMVGAPPAAYLAYGLGLKFFALPQSWDLFSLWFASSLFAYYLLFSFIGKHRKLTVFTVLSITIGIMVYFSTVNQTDWIFFWNFFVFLLPFAIGFLWKLDFQNKKVLVLLPALLLLPYSTLSVQLPGSFGTFVGIGVNWLKNLITIIAPTALLLYVFSKIKWGKIGKAATWVSTGALFVYCMEPIWGMWIIWLIYPQYAGNASVQFGITPEQSLLRLLLTIPIAFIVSPLLYHIYMKFIKKFSDSKCC
jgi:hypothetical protein